MIFHIVSIIWFKHQLKRQRQFQKSVFISISLNNTIVIEVVLKIIFIYKINQIDCAAMHAAISKCQIKKDVLGFTTRIQTVGNNEK